MTAARDMYQRAGWTLAFTLVFYYINRIEYPGPALTIALILLLLTAAFVAVGYAVHWFATAGQERVRTQILDAAALTGSERVLDIGGSLGVLAAKRLKSGKVIAVGDLTANEASRELAKREGIVDKVRFEAGDPKKLSYPDANFDIVLSSRVLEALDDTECSRALQEIARVLKPGGRLVLHVVGDAGRYTSELDSAKLPGAASPTSLPFGLGGKVFSALKSAL
jgi:SAM-dependent methyltransferase